MTSLIKRFTFGLTILIVTIGLIGLCWNVLATNGDQNSSQEETTPDVAIADLGELVTGNTAFAFDLYQNLSKEGENLFFSPYSISLALAMTYAGARSATEEQMAETLHFSTLGQDRLHPAFNALALELASRGEDTGDTEETEEEKKDRFQLHIANALWGQDGYRFLTAFLDVLAENYGAGVRISDFIDAPEQARMMINRWVSDETEERIEDLLPPGSITSLTRLVLTNAIYFNATWKHRFDEGFTHDCPFTLLDGSQITVSMMKQIKWFRHVEEEGRYKAVELPYVGDELSMVILLPAADQFEKFSRELNAEQVRDILNNMVDTEDIYLYMPKFEYASEFNLKATLSDLGMPDAFVFGTADFSGMDGSRELFIGDVFHKAFVSVDENGTEAAAATAFPIPCAMVPVIRLDHPFIFLIRDSETGTILFMGRVMDPTGS
jgi:serpin B